MRKLSGVVLVVLGVSGIASGVLVLSGGGAGSGFGVYDTLIGVGLLVWGMHLQRTREKHHRPVASTAEDATLGHDRIAEFEAHDGYWRDLGHQWVTSRGETSRDFTTLSEAQQAYLAMGYMTVGQSKPFDFNARPRAGDGRITLTFAPAMPSMYS